MTTDLFAPYRLGSLELRNRFVMAPMTRNRAGAGEAPTDLNAEYYAQRAGAGLIVTEGTQPSAVGQGYPGTPGLHTDEQVAGWRLVADAVHERGGQRRRTPARRPAAPRASARAAARSPSCRRR